MKTKKPEEFLTRARSLPKLKFAVVGAGTTWTFYEGADLAKAVAKPDEQLIKASCQKKKEDVLALSIVGTAAEVKIFKDKVFKKQLDNDSKSLTFKAVTAKDDSALEALAMELDGPLAELVGRLPADQRTALVPLLNQAKALAAEGELAQAMATVQELKTRTQGGSADNGNAASGDDAMRKKIVAHLRGAVVERIAALPMQRRQALTAVFNDTMREASEGDIKAAALKLAQLEKAVAGGGDAASTTAPTRPAQGPQAAQQQAQPQKPGQPTSQTAAQQKPAKPLPQVPQNATPLSALQAEVKNLLFKLPDNLGPVFVQRHKAEMIQISQEIDGLAVITDERAARLKVLTLRDRAAVISKEAQSVSAINTAAIAIAIAFPKRQNEVAQKAAAAIGANDPKVLADTLAELKRDHDRLKTEGPPRAAKAKAKIDSLSDAELKKLSYAQCNALMADLRQGDPATDAERKAAMAKLFKALPLDPKFKTRDDAKRKRVLDALKDPSTGLADAARNWNKMPNPKLGPDGKPDPASLAKVKVLEKALAIQCRELGIDPVPKIKLFSDPATKATDQQKLTLSGYFNPSDGQIYLNDESPNIKNDFDNALDTIIHENTHNFQTRLVADLDAGRLKPGDDDYEQALMFRLNSGKGGYIDGGDGYEEQPVELHAWMAGGEARKAFFADAQAEAQLLVEKMRKWVELNPGKSTSVPQWIGFVQKAIDSGKTNEAAEKTSLYEQEFKRAVAEAQAQSGGANLGPREQAKALAGEMEDWLKTHPEKEGDLRRLIEDLNNTSAPMAKVRGFVERYPGLFNQYKSA